jgi:cytochrome b6-f complex iron-sulfur subunit
LTAVEPTTPTNTTTRGARSRRDVLCGLMVALVAPGAVVAACSDADSGSPSTPTNGGGGSATPGGGQGLAALADIPDGGGLLVDKPDGGGVLLLVKNGEDVIAYDAACTHMGTTIETPKDGVAICPNHGSKFAMADGAVQKGPATQPLTKVNVKVDGDQVVMA